MRDFSPLEEIEELLDPNIFFRANRQAIINISAAHSVKLAVQLKPPIKIEVDISREKSPLFRKWMDR
jgi:DNA-binding LytR/AlgR family response regulator